jgi:hypothetical protein
MEDGGREDGRTRGKEENGNKMARNTKYRRGTRKSGAGITRTASFNRIERQSVGAVGRIRSPGHGGHTTVRVESTGIACYVGTCCLEADVYTSQATGGHRCRHGASSRPTGCWVVTSGTSCAFVKGLAGAGDVGNVEGWASHS